ncbi:unnamed protein product [Closterium sp. Naga37s-1]|nr:unnamed protein product [Closterium sp. Naga37s-1]
MPWNSLEFYQQWYNVREDEYELYHHVWEQANLNNVAREPQWRGKVIVVPHAELTGPQGAFVRHVWAGLPEGEHGRVVVEALEEALGFLQ